MNALSLAGRQGAVDDNAVGGVLRVGVILLVGGDGGQARARLVHLVVVAVIGSSTDAAGDGVSGLPVSREVDASSVVDAGGLLGVLRLTRLLVHTDGIALGSLVLLLREVFGIGRAPDAKENKKC